MSDDKVKLLADAIRLELLGELRMAKDADAVASIQQRADALNQLDNRDFGAVLSAPTEPAPEPNREFVRACLRFRDDGRDWSGEILLETSDGEVKRAVCAGLGGETALIRLDGVERMTEFRIREAERGVEQRLSWVVAHQGANPTTEGSVG